ncbi:alpha/beta hydrolase [Erythrobacter sp.]|uniref:alpha/beta hydrolase n=1 Tax=Erythrobacter sp. TaxID=1042 RepID=UPI002EAE067D|nr:alpha/beta hydrolase [Erythrobacter sp.]
MRIFLWTAGIVAALGLAGALALQYSVGRNGPKMLTALDRVAGGSNGAELKATVPLGGHEARKLVVWGPEQAQGDEPLPVLVFAHGGGWKSGDPEDYGFVARAFVPEGFVVVLAGYRLNEDGIYPAMIEDTADVVGWTHREIAQYGGDPAHIALAGHSAGAYNVVMLALEERWLEEEDVPQDAIQGVIGIAGPYDFLPLARDSSRDAFGDADMPETTQPVNFARAGAPPLLLVHGDEDTVVRPRNSVALARAMEAAGGEAILALQQGMDHNRPIVELAAPFRGDRTMLELMAGFAKGGREAREVSVPVQAAAR